MSDQFEHIGFAIDDRVARVTFSRPPLNVFNIAMMREVGAALAQCINHREIVAIVFAAAPECRAFSAGVAVEEHVPETIYQMLDAFHGIFRVLEQLAKPTIAVVDGAALGGGCELALACDIVIASERARFGQPEIKLGVFPPIAAILLPRLIGQKKARELILTGDTINAAEALRLGLVNQVVPSEELQNRTESILNKLRDLSGVVLGMARAALDLGTRSSFESELKQVETLYFEQLMKTEDANEGVQSFMEKRKPVWRNK